MPWDDDFPEAALAPTVYELGTDLRALITWLARGGFRAVQMGASGPNGLRPRSMSGSARRDLALSLRRAGLMAAGVDLWIPAEHFQESDRVDRAVDAVQAACRLAADLDRCPLTMRLSDTPLSCDVQEAIGQSASACGVRISALGCAELPPWCDHCVDPPLMLEAGEDPVAAAANPTATVRLCDLVAGVRSAPVAGGLLDVLAYRTACQVAAPRRPVVADLRFLADPTASLSTMRQAWDRSA